MRARYLVLLIAASCSSSSAEAPAQAAACREPLEALLVAGDGTSSQVGGVTLAGRAMLRGGSDLGGDPQLTTSAGRAFCVARDNEKIFEIDACGAKRGEWSTADPAAPGTTNPQDVAVAPDGTLWVPRFGRPTIAVLPVKGSGGTIETIDLRRTPRADPDGNPNASSIRIVEVGERSLAFVALGRLDDNELLLLSKQPSTMLVLDVATRQVVDEVELAVNNPFNLMVEHDGGLYLAGAGRFDSATDARAGIARFDVTTRASRIVIGESTLGGTVTAFALSGTCGAAIVADPTPDVNATSLVTFDLASGQMVVTVADSPLRTTGFELTAIIFRGDTLLVGDKRRAADGYPVHVFDRTDDCGLRARPAPIFVGLQPVALRVLP